MARPLTRKQALENRAFLKALSRTGNVRLSAREVGLAYSTMQHRRKHHPVFATKWDAAIAAAHAALHEGGPQRPSVARRHPSDRARVASETHRTKGGETVIIQNRDGTLQIRRAQPGKLTRECEQAFLAALSATCNVRLSAAAAGAAEAAFYRRRRRHAGFAREWQLALEAGYERLEMALMESFTPWSFEDDAWRHNEPPAIPQMTAAQALQLLHLHDKTAKGRAALFPAYDRMGRRGRIDASEARAHQYIHDRFRRAEDILRADTERALTTAMNKVGFDIEPSLPALSLVTGWSKADPTKKPWREELALFGGWRIWDLEGR